jgi:hypothetical protein
MSNNIIDKKDLDDFDSEVQKYLSYFALSGMQMSLKGSSQYKDLLYRSDYDVLINVRKDIAPTKVFNDLKEVLERISKDDNTYFIELKLQTKEDHKTRFHHGDNFSYSDFEKDYANLKFFKIDIVMLIKNRFFEASCIYALSNDELLTKENIVKNIKQDIEEYLAEGNYYKVLKRWFSIYVMYNAVSSIDLLVSVFNSELGKLYEKICNLQGIEVLHKYYEDDKTLQRINNNLELLGETFNIKTIHRKINAYLKLLNTEARKIYKGMKDDIKYP